MKKKIGYWVYILFLCLIWGIVIALSVEFSTRILLRIGNFLYKPYFEAQNRKVYGMVSASEQARRYKPIQEIPQNREKTIKSTPTTTLQRNNTPCDKNYELTLEGMAEFYFDRNGKLTKWYGDPLIGNYIQLLLQGKRYGYYNPDWNNFIEDIKNNRFPVNPIRLRYEYFYILQYEIQSSPNQEGVLLSIREIRDAYPLSLKPQNTITNEDSPWLVPFYSYKPNWEKAGNIAKYNNFGFRDDDIIMPKPEGYFRIVCVGGSTTEEGNSNELTYPNIMEKKLRSHFNTDKIEVINCGICGIRSFGEVRRINDYLQFDPNLLVYYNAINDICYHYIPYWLTLPNPYKKILQHSVFLNRLFNRKLLPSDDYIAEYFRDNILRHLGAMNCACKNKGVQMAICSFAYPKLKWYEFVPKSYCDFNIRNVWVSLEDVMITFDTYLKIIHIYNQELKNFCEREHILYIPVAEEFNAGMDHFFDICHMTPLGMETKTEIIGSYIAQWIKEKGFLK